MLIFELEISILSGISLVALWLRLHTPNVGGLDLIPPQRTRSHMLQLRPYVPKEVNIKKKRNHDCQLLTSVWLVERKEEFHILFFIDRMGRIMGGQHSHQAK